MATIDKVLIRDHVTLTYPVNEIYDTIQGEGSYTGTPATFVRLQGCPVGCGWCDTKYTWDLVADDRDDFGDIAQAKADPLYRRMSAESIAKQCNLDHVVLTGGEPLLHDCEALITALILCNKTVQIETAGVFPLPYTRKNLYVTVSPKFDMPGGLKVLESALRHADEIKLPVGKQKDIDRLIEYLPAEQWDRVWLQPLSQSKKATKLCVEACKKLPHWRLSVQTHKYVDIP